MKNKLIISILLLVTGIAIGETFYSIYPATYIVATEFQTGKYGAVIKPNEYNLLTVVPTEPRGTEAYTPMNLSELLISSKFYDGVISQNCGQNIPPNGLKIEPTSAGLYLSMKGRDLDMITLCLNSINGKLKDQSDLIVDMQSNLMRTQLDLLERYYQSHFGTSALPARGSEIKNNKSTIMQKNLLTLISVQKKQMEKPITVYSSFEISKRDIIFPIRIRTYVAGILAVIYISLIYFASVNLSKVKKI